MRFLRCILVTFVTVTLVSCTVKMPDDVLSHEKMKALLYDYHKVQAMSSEYADADYQEKMFFNYVFDKHGVTKRQFEHSMQWYNRYPKHMKNIYAELEAQVEGEIEKLSAMTGGSDEGVSLELAYLDSDTSELWTGVHNKILSATNLQSYITFDFNAPSDSTFVAGDSLSFSFHALFASGGAPGVKQSAHAGLALWYDGGVRDFSGVEVDSSGVYVLTFDRRAKNRISRATGFVYYNDNDTSCVARLLLNDISVRRIHPEPPEKD